MNIFNLLRLYKRENLAQYIGLLMDYLPIEFQDKKIKLSDFFPGQAQLKTDLNLNIIGAILNFESIDFLIKFLESSESLNKTISSKEGTPLLVVMKMHDFGSDSSRVDKTKLKQAIDALLKNGADVSKKDSFGKNFLDYINEKDEHGSLVRPEINKIYKEYEEYKKEYKNALTTAFPPELGKIIFEYSN